jgi:hypothetical protein
MCGEIFIVCRLDEGEWTIGRVEQSHVNPNSWLSGNGDAIDLPRLMATPGAPFSDRPSKGFSLSESEPCDDDPLGAADLAEPVTFQLADELSAVGSQTGDDGVDVSFRRDRWPAARIDPA